MTISPTKKCSRCKTVKPSSDFYRDTKQGLRHICIACWRADNRRRAEGYKRRGVTVAEKRCPHCGETKAATEFFRFRSRADGLSAWCKQCTGDKNKQWRNANREHHRALVARWQRANRDHHRDLQRRWWQTDKGILAAKRKRAYRLGAHVQGTHTQAEWLELCDTYNNRCARCCRRLPLTKDHIVPISRGGDDTIANLQPMCLPCNISKKDRIAFYPPLRLALPA